MRRQRAWTAVEAEPGGDCEVAFERRGDGRIGKKKVRFVRVERNGTLVAAEATVGVPDVRALQRELSGGSRWTGAGRGGGACLGLEGGLHRGIHPRPRPGCVHARFVGPPGPGRRDGHASGAHAAGASTAERHPGRLSEELHGKKNEEKLPPVAEIPHQHPPRRRSGQLRRGARGAGAAHDGGGPRPEGPGEVDGGQGPRPDHAVGGGRGRHAPGAGSAAQGRGGSRLPSARRAEASGRRVPRGAERQRRQHRQVDGHRRQGSGPA